MLLLLLFFSSTPLRADEEIRIVATTTALANLAAEIAGDRAEIYSIASPRQNLHFIAPTPRDVLKVKRADVFVHVGLDLEAWRPPLIDAAGRPDFICPSGSRQIDASRGVALLEIPVTLSRSEGDIHAYGNPHYWLDPENGKIAARNIAEGLARLYPEDAARFRANEAAFEAKLDLKIKEWHARLSPFKGKAVVTYHKSWPYFAQRFGLDIAGELEPKPGIPPTAKHLAELEQVMRQEKIRIIIKEAFFENRSPEKLAKKTGAKVLNFAQAVGEVAEAGDYVSMIDYNVRQLAGAFKETEGSP